MMRETPMLDLRAQNTPRHIAESWKLTPSIEAAQAEDSVSAALWRWISEGSVEYRAVTPDDYTIMAFMEAGRARVSHYQNDHHVHDRFAEAGMTNVIPAGTDLRSIVSNAQLHLLHLYVPQTLVARVADEAELPATPEIVNRSLCRDHRVATLARGLLEELRAPALASRLWIEGLSQQLAIALLRGHSALAGLEAARGGLAPWQERRATEMIRDTLAARIGLDAVAAELGISRFHFARAFRDTVGMSPQQFQTVARVEEAKRLLTETHLGMAAIAEKVGYATPQAFARGFRKIEGRSPRDWQRLYRRD